MAYFKFKKALKPMEVFDLILNMSADDENVCKDKPVGVVKEGAFVVTTSLGNDIKADDLGVWLHKGKPLRKYKIMRADSGIVYGSDLTKESGENVYHLTRIYYHHKNTPTCRRTLYYITG